VAVGKLVRKQIYATIDVVVDRACKVYKESTGKDMMPKAIVLIKTALMTSADLIDDAASNPEEINLSYIGMMSLKRAIAITGFTLDEKNAAQCGVSLAALAIATVEYFGLMVAGSGVIATGVGAIPAAAAMLSASVFYAYQADDLIKQCGEAYVATTEANLAERYNIQSKRAMMTNYGDNVCRAPDLPSAESP
jgi:hypothetical protein